MVNIKQTNHSGIVSILASPFIRYKLPKGQIENDRIACIQDMVYKI